MPPQDSGLYVPEREPSARRRRIILILTVLVLVASVGVVYGFKDKIPFLRGIKKEHVAPRQAATSGALLLTLFPKGSNSIGIYSFDVALGKLAPIYAPAKTASMTASMYKGTSTLLFATNAVNDPKGKIATPQIVSYNIDTKVRTQITSSPSGYKRFPSYSSVLDAVVYSARTPEGSKQPLSSTNDYKVYVHEPGGNERLVGDGAMPALIPDGKSVVVLQSGGLALLDLVRGNSEIIWPVAGGTTWLNQHFALSPKGKYIVWSNPDEGIIRIMKVLSWSPFKAEAAQQITARALWPVFSPDESQLVFEEIDDVKNPTKGEVVLYDLVTPQRKVLLDLGGYDQASVFLTNWY